MPQSQAITLSLLFFYFAQNEKIHTRQLLHQIFAPGWGTVYQPVQISGFRVPLLRHILSSRLIFYCPDLDKRPNYLKVLLCVFSGDFFYITDGWLMFIHRLWLPSVLRLRYPLRFFFRGLITWPNFLIAPPQTETEGFLWKDNFWPLWIILIMIVISYRLMPITSM